MGVGVYSEDARTSTYKYNRKSNMASERESGM